MRNSLIITVIVCCAFASSEAKADSPLTSTPFGQAYIGKEGFPVIKKGDAISLYKYLNDQSVPVDYRLAAINLDGWSTNGLHRTEGFKKYLEQAYNIKGLGDILTYCPADVLICYAYLEAMDDYFHVDESLAIACKAAWDMPENNTIFLICTLIWAQKFLDNDEDWSSIYVWPNVARLASEKMVSPMLPEAERIIFEYIDEYRPYFRATKKQENI